MAYHNAPLYKELFEAAFETGSCSATWREGQDSGSFHKWGDPKILVFLVGNPSYKWMIWGYPFFSILGNPQIKFTYCLVVYFVFFVPSLLGNIIGAMDSHCWHTYNTSPRSKALARPGRASFSQMKPVGKPLHTPHDIYVLAQNCLFALHIFTRSLIWGKKQLPRSPLLNVYLREISLATTGIASSPQLGLY